MLAMSLDLSSLQKAVHSLERAIHVSEAFADRHISTDETEVIRAGVIQNFEFTYELCWKFMKRWIESNGSGSTVDGVTMKELFRMAAERQLISGTGPWFIYHQQRNQTTHIYDADIAQEVFETSVRFLDNAKELLLSLESKND